MIESADVTGRPDNDIAGAGPSEPALPSGVRLLAVTTISATLEAFITPYALHFRGLGWKVDAAAHGALDNPAVGEAFVDVYDLPMSRSLLDLRGLLKGRAAIGEVLRTARPDIVHVHTPIAGFMTRLAIRMIPRSERPAVVYTAHGFHFYKGGSRLTNAVFRIAERLAGRWTDRLVVINDEDYAAAHRLHIVPSGRLVRMPGIGVDTSHYQRSKVSPADVSRVREELGVGEAFPIFVVVGELNRNKRQRDVVIALARMRHTDAHLVLAGSLGPETERVKRLVAELGLRDRVHFAGFVRKMPSLVCASTAVILASSREGLARSVMEALSLEVPVIASTARGNRELLGGDSGILFPIGDSAALARAMDDVLDRPEEARAMARRGRRRMVEMFDLAPVIRQHEMLYRDVLEERVARP